MNAVRLPATPFAGKSLLMRALAHGLGSEAAAEQFLKTTLWDAGMDGVPEVREGFESFVREEILPRLMPLLRLDRLHDVIRRTLGEEGSLHPAPLRQLGAAPGAGPKPGQRPRVVVVEQDGERRLMLSRELVRAGFDLEVVERAEQLLTVEAFHAVLLSLDDLGLAAAEELARRRTRSGLVAYDDPGHRAAIKRVIGIWPSERVVLVARAAAPTTICARVRMVVQ